MYMYVKSVACRCDSMNGKIIRVLHLGGQEMDGLRRDVRWLLDSFADLSLHICLFYT